MYSIANKFYQGSLNKFGFGTWDSVNPPMLSIKSPYTPKPTSYKQNISTLPAISRNNTYHNEMTEVNSYNNNRNGNRNSAITEHMKLNIMEDRIRRLNNRLENENNQQRYYPSQLYQSSNNNNTTVNTNMIMTEVNPPIAMINDVYSKEREERRKYIQNEIRLAKMKLNNEKINTDNNGMIHCNCNYNNTNESFRPKKKQKLQIQTDHKEPTHAPSFQVINSMPQPIERIELCTCPKRSKDIRAYEKEKFIHRMPPHIALKLQKENFKTRSAMESVFHRYNSIYEDYESKLKQLELRQYINFQKLRNVLEYAGNKRIRGAVERYIDGENINLNALKEEAQDYLRDFPFIMDGKIVIHENKRRAEQKEAIEEIEDAQESEDDEEILPENVIMPECNPNENYTQRNGKKGNKNIRRMQRAACGTTVIIPNVDNKIGRAHV